MDYVSIDVKIRKDGKWLDHWSDLDIENLLKVKKMVAQLECDMDAEISDKDYELRQNA